MRHTVLRPLALTLCFATAASAQAPEEPEEPESWNAEAGLSLNSSGGNEDLTVFTTNAAISHLQTDIFELGLSARFRYGRSEGEKVAENIRSEMNFDLWPQARWSPFLFATVEKDPFKRLDARLNGGAGAKRTFLQDGWTEVSVSGAALYSYENLAVHDSLGTGISQTARWSWRVRGRKEFGSSSRLEQTVFYQPAWNEFSDYQLESITSARFALSDQLAITTTLLYQRDSTPAPDVKPDDYSIAVGLSMSTQW